MKKRFLSILMALCMMLTLAVPSVAAGDTVDPPIDETSVTQETGGGTEGQEPPETPETPETPEDSTPPASPEDAGGPEEGGETGDPSSGGEGSVPPAEEPPINEGDFTITPDMTQEEVDTAVNNATGIITVQAGNYSDEQDEKQYHKAIIVTKDQSVVELNGNYTRFQIIVRAENVTLRCTGNTTLTGQASTVYNPAAAIAIQAGSLNIDTGEFDLTITDYNNGIRMGVNTGGNTTVTELIGQDTGLTITTGSSVKIIKSANFKNYNITEETAYYDSYNDHGDGGVAYAWKENSLRVEGASGSGLFVNGSGKNQITLNAGSEFIIGGAEEDANGNSGIYLLSGAKGTDFILQSATLVSSYNEGNGLFEDNEDPIFYIDATSSRIKICHNNVNGIAGHAASGGTKSVVKLRADSQMYVDDNGSIGSNNTLYQLESSYLSVSHNGSHGATQAALNAINSKIVTSGNVYRGLSITNANSQDSRQIATVISNSKIIAEDNKQSGIYFINPEGTTIENGSTVQTEGNGSSAPGSSFSGAGIVGSYDITIANSSVNSKDPHSFSVSHTSSAPAVWCVKENTIAVAQGTSTASDQDIVDDPNSGHPEYLGNVIITGGSLNASQDIDYTSYQKYLKEPSNWKYEDIEALVSMTNDQKEDLFRFHLNAESNAVVGGAGQKQFNYPYQNNSESLNYQFVYDENGDAYVWTPVTVVNYDATEGTVQEGSFGTATPIEDSTQGLDAGDVTIYGNSLALAEKTLPTATRNGYVFGGWYYAVGQENISQAAQYASEGKYNDLYTLLKERGAKLESTTLTSEDGEDLSNITVYAVWEEAVISIKPVNLTVYMGGDDGYEAVVGDGTTIGTSSNSLPQPIFTLQASDGTENLNGLQFKSEEKTWTAQVIRNVDGTPSDYYTLTAAEGQDPVRVTYTGEDEIPHISDSFEIIQEGDVFTTYEIALYTNQVEIGSVTATLNGKTYSVNASQTGKLTVRAVEDTEDNAAVSPVVKEAPPERLESGTGLIVAKPDTQYTVNNLGIPVPEGSAPSLLFDSIITNDGIDRETRLEQEVAEQLPELGSNQTRYYQSQYLDLVDANNGNIWLKANQAITVYWAYPQGTDANDDFTLWHFEGLHRDGEDSGFDIGDVEAAQLEQVTIQKDAYGISFTVEPGGFSPFVLTWTEYDRPPVDPNPDPDPDPTPDPDPEDPDKPELNTEDHYAYIVGYPDGNVKPEGNITRAEVATIFFRLLTDESRDEFWSQTNPYSDVSEDDWYNNAVSTLTNAGIIDGYEDGTFKPNGNITRAEFATIAVRFFEATYEGENLFPDIDGHWAQDYINEAANAGIVDGYPDGTFGPQKRITRAEAMTMVNRTIDRHPHEDHLLADMIVWPDNPETAWYYEQVQEATNSHEYTMNTDDEQNPYEIWTELLPVRDWAQLEKEWSDAHSGQSGGDVV